MNVRISKSATIAASETTSRQLDDFDVEAPVDLYLPLELKHASMGGEVAWAQFVAKWLQRPTSGVLKTYFKNSEHIEQIAPSSLRYLPQLIAVLGSSIIHYSDGSPVDPKRLRELALIQLSILQSSNPLENTRGRVCQILAADHLGRGKPKFLYDGRSSPPGQLRTRKRYVDLSRFLLNKFQAWNFDDENRREIETSLGTVMYEIFRNTEDHGRTNLDKSPLSFSMRGMHMEIHGQTKSAIGDIASGFQPMADFVSQLEEVGKGRHSSLISLSIFDNGIGFASRRSGRALLSLNLDEEEILTRQCFTKSTSKGHRRFGQGLVLLGKVLERNGGFLHLRTGRHTFFFDGNVHKAGADFSEALQTYVSDNRPTVNSGTSLTIILPMPGQR